MLARKWACEADEQFKLRKTDGQISEVFNPNFIISFMGSKSLINTVFSSGYKVFGFFRIESS